MTHTVLRYVYVVNVNITVPVHSRGGPTSNISRFCESQRLRCFDTFVILIGFTRIFNFQLLNFLWYFLLTYVLKQVCVCLYVYSRFRSFFSNGCSQLFYSRPRNPYLYNVRQLSILPLHVLVRFNGFTAMYAHTDFS